MLLVENKFLKIKIQIESLVLLKKSSILIAIKNALGPKQ